MNISTDVLKRKDNENDFEYKVRLCLAKLDKEIDLDWIEIVDLLGLECSSDHLRKLSYGYKEMQEHLNENKIRSIDDDEKLKEIRKERKKIQSLRYAMHRDERVESRFEILYEDVKNSIENLEPPAFKSVPSIVNQKEYILTISDVHYGACFKSINNEYSREICKSRFEKLLSSLKAYIKENNIRKLKILELGDSLQGILRLSDLKMNDIAVVDALVEFSQLMASFLNDLSEVCYVEYFHVPSANHTQNRPLSSKASELANEDMEKIIINYVADMLRSNSRVKVCRKTEGDRILFDIGGFKCISLHGHQIKNIKNSLRDLSQLHRVFFDYAFLGHFHGGNEITVGESLTNSTEVLVAPSFIGSCPYSDTLALGSKSMCKLYEFDEIEGHIGTRNFILN